jgi:tetratricopeptide (TPR) repeat protein
MAMDAAHRAGIVHRDLKSANILFSVDGIPKVTDFGLAKRLEAEEGQTQTGQIMGTPSYMAPEQARGDTKLAGPPADIYALGAMLYEMLTGRPPFKGVSAMDTVKQVLEHDPVSPSRVQYHVPRDLETICMKCLQKDPRKRYATAQEMANDLNRYLRGEPIKARRTPPHELAIKWVKRRPAKATALAFMSAGLLGLVCYGAWYWNHQQYLERLAERHLARVRDETGEDLYRAQDAITRKAWTSANSVLSARRALLVEEKHPALKSLTERTAQMLAGVDSSINAEQALQAEEKAKIAVQERYRRFLEERSEAFFRHTQSDFKAVDENSLVTTLLPESDFDKTRKAAEAALSVFGDRRADNEWNLGELPPSLSTEQKAEVLDGCYELLMVLADELSSQNAAQADRALNILDCAMRFRPDRPRAYHIQRASILEVKNDRAGADRELAEAAVLPPTTALDYFLIGQDDYKHRRIADAIDDFDIVLRLKPDHFWAKCVQAICFIQTTRYDAAKSNLIGCIQAEPELAWLYVLRGFASGQLGARNLKLVATSPGRETDLKKVADSEFDKAETDFQAAFQKLRRAPDTSLSYVALVNRGLCRYLRGNFDEAVQDFLTAIQTKQDPNAYANLAFVYRAQGKPDQALIEFDKAITLKPDWAALYRGRAQIRQDRPGATPADRAAAVADLKMAIRKEKADNRVVALDRTNLAKLFYLDEQYPDALNEAKLALEVFPEFVDAQVVEIQVLLKLRHYDEVIRACDNAITMGKKSAVVYELRGLARAARNDYAGAVQDYSRALEIRPHDARLLVHRGWAYLLFDSPKPALVDFEDAVKVNPTDADARNGRGMAHARLGDHRAAVANAREALKLGNANSRVTYNAARIYAIAASAAAAELGAEKSRVGRPISSHYQDVAVQLIREAMEQEPPAKRAGFWQDAIEPDPALKAIRRRLNYQTLIAPEWKPGL